MVCVGLGVGKAGGSWETTYLVETGLELSQNICHDFVVEGAEGVDSGRSVRMWAAFRCCFLGRLDSRIAMAFLQLQ